MTETASRSSVPGLLTIAMNPSGLMSDIGTACSAVTITGGTSFIETCGPARVATVSMSAVTAEAVPRMRTGGADWAKAPVASRQPSPASSAVRLNMCDLVVGPMLTAVVGRWMPGDQPGSYLRQKSVDDIARKSAMASPSRSCGQSHQAMRPSASTSSGGKR